MFEQNIDVCVTDADDAADAIAAQIAQGLTVEQQNYKYSCAARDRAVMSLKKNQVSARPIVETRKIVPDVCVADSHHAGERVRRGRGIYGMNARRNRAAS